MILLYEIVQVLCDALQGTLNNNDFLTGIMPIIMSQMESISFQDRRFFSYYECLGSISSALEFGFLPFAQASFIRSLGVISQVQEAYAVSKVF